MKAPRSRRIVGRAVETTSVSSAPMKEPMAVKTTTHAIDRFVSVACGLIGSPFAVARLGGPLHLEIRRALRIHRSRQAEVGKELGRAERGDLADFALLVEVEHDDPLGPARALGVSPGGAERRLAVRLRRNASSGVPAASARAA